MRILIVDDDCGLVDAISIGLRLQWSNVEVLSAGDGQQAVELFARHSPDLTLLDINLPLLNGWEVLKQMRQISDAPIILLTARGEEMDKIHGLGLGADDYMTKPFSHRELFARMKAILRRARSTTPINTLPSFVSGDLSMNFASREVCLAGRPIKLTPKEYRLLYLLVRNAGRILPFDTLLAQVWGDNYLGHTGYLKTYISRLRNKLGDDTEHPRYIVTERGAGYRFARPMLVHA